MHKDRTNNAPKAPYLNITPFNINGFSTTLMSCDQYSFIKSDL